MQRRESEPEAGPVNVVMFADITDSSGLYRQLGEDGASKLITSILDQMQALVDSGGGRTLDRIGDELFCLFPDPDSALFVALNLEDVIQAAAEDAELGHRILLRIGLHAGKIIERDGRVFGDCVYAAKRVTDLAKGGQILVGPTLASAAQDAGLHCRFLKQLTLKGQDHSTALSEVLRDAVEETVLASARALPAPELVLVLKHGEQQYTIEPDCSLSIGRTTPSELLIDNPQISRLHARITNEDGHIVLQDFSTNGTYVGRASSEKPEYLHRSSTVLRGEGLIAFGVLPSSTTAHTLRYRAILAHDQGPRERAQLG